MTLQEHADALERSVADPRIGLPDEVFAMVTRLTPMINVDLLVKTSDGFLLTWRDDGIFPPGWHIPGGIIRFMERISERIDAVARIELGAELGERRELLNVHEFFYPELPMRNHFISLLYSVELTSEIGAKRCQNPADPAPGEYGFFRKAPGV